MTCLTALFITLLVPVSVPVSGGRATEFRFMRGLVPSSDWTAVPVFPYTVDSTFSSVTCSGGSRRGFRSLSSGSTAGIHPSIGSWVDQGGYAGFLSAAGALISVCDFGHHSLTASFKSVTLDYRETGGLHGEFQSELIMAAGGSNAFTAGISPVIAENLRAGPSWFRDENGQGPWLEASFSAAGLVLESGTAVTDSMAHRRASAIYTRGSIMAGAGWDGVNLFGVVSPVPSLRIQWPEWGVHSLCSPFHWAIVQVSHREKGSFQGEIQALYRGFTCGLLLWRRPGGIWTGGYTLGISI